MKTERLWPRKLFILLAFTTIFAATASAQQLSVTVTSTASCMDDGTATANVTGGTPPYTYYWSIYWNNTSTTQTGQTASNLPGGAYAYIQVDDANGAAASGSVTITRPIQFISTSTQAHCPVSDGTITVTITKGTGPYTFLWSNGAITQNLSGLSAGQYRVTITDANGCFQRSDSAVYVGDGNPIYAYVSNTTPEKCHNDGAATVTASGGVAPYTYLWNTTPAQNKQTATGLSAKNYQVTVTDVNGCSTETTAYIYLNSNIYANTQTFPEHCSAKDGSITSSVSGGGAPPYSYLWSNGAITSNITGLSSDGTIYHLTITDVNGCVATPTINPVYNSSPITLSFTGTPERCHDDGTITVTASKGTAPYTYAWDNGTTKATASSLKAGYYNVTVYDNAGCYTLSSYSISYQSLFHVTSTMTPEHCIAKDGTLSIAVSGGTAPYHYSWSNGGQTANISGLAAGPYSLFITDANGCKKNFDTAHVTNQSPIILNTTYTQSACHDGTATANASKGTVPYAYYWNTSPIQTTKTAVGLDPGYYSVRVTDSKGCYKNADRYVSASSIISADLTTTNEHCHDANGTAMLSNVSGGIPPYTYKWSHSTTTGASATGLSYGSYTVIITDKAGCNKIKDFIIYSNSPVHTDLTYTAPSCNNADGTATVSASGGSSPYSYYWSNGQNTKTATNLPEGYYGVQVTDTKNCDHYEYIYVAEPANCNIGLMGTVYNDENGDCVANNGEIGLPLVLVSATPGYYTFTDINGNYYFGGKANKTYVIGEDVPKYFSQICPAAPGIISVTPGPGTVSADNNFYVKALADTNDLGVGIYNYWEHPLRPGFENDYYLYYYNAGNTRLSGNISFVHDTAVTFLGSNPMPDNYDATKRTANYSFVNLAPRHGGYIPVYIKALSNIPLGTNACFNASITPLVNDNNPKDNQFQYCQELSGSYDPNLIEVSPKGIGTSGTISPADSILNYTIHFQNTGTDTAFTVVVLDTLDSHLNVASIKQGGSSHSCQIDIKPGNILTATFKHILLPDSNINEKKSHGFVNISLKLKPNQSSGTVIKGRGHIYFDYNTPVSTNTAINTLFIKSTTGIPNVAVTKALIIYPNPMTQSATVHILNYNSKNVYAFTLYDLTGRIVKYMSQVNAETFTIEKDNLSPAMYFYKLENNGNTIGTGKLVMQ